MSCESQNICCVTLQGREIPAWTGPRMACVLLGSLYIDRDHRGVDRDSKGQLLPYNLSTEVKSDNRLCSFETLCPGTCQA